MGRRKQRIIERRLMKKPGIYAGPTFGPSLVGEIAAEFGLKYESLENGEYRFEIPQNLSRRDANSLGERLLRRLSARAGRLGLQTRFEVAGTC